MKRGKELVDFEKKLFEYEGEDRIVSSLEIAKELDRTKEVAISFKTGIPSMDRILEDIEAGEVIMVTGPTGEGKTSLLMSITRNMVEKGVKSVWFTLEVTSRQFIKKLTARGGELPLFYMPAKNLDNHIQWIEDRIVEAVVKYDCKVVFIDHLHEIFNLFQARNNSSLEIGHLVSIIKNIAIQYNLAIFLIVHCRDNPMTPFAEPRKEDIRDSGLISRIADTIIGIWRIKIGEHNVKKRPKELDENDTWAKVKILKNRGEGTMGYWIMDHKDHYLEEVLIPDF